MIEHAATPPLGCHGFCPARLRRARCSARRVVRPFRRPTASAFRLRPREFRAYVERVFREQNRVADELAFALEAPGAERAELGAAEQRLLDACAGVNELATARRDERRLGLRRSSSAARTVSAMRGSDASAAVAVGGGSRGA